MFVRTGLAQTLTPAVCTPISLAASSTRLLETIWLLLCRTGIFSHSVSCKKLSLNINCSSSFSILSKTKLVSLSCNLVNLACIVLLQPVCTFSREDSLGIGSASCRLSLTHSPASRRSSLLATVCSVICNSSLRASKRLQ